MTSRLIIKRGPKCERCPYSRIEILQVHHKDRNKEHNELSNLELICPNCHFEEHYLEKSSVKKYNIEIYRQKLLFKEHATSYSKERSHSWSSAEVLKTSRCQSLVGSNPTLSANLSIHT